MTQMDRIWERLNDRARLHAEAAILVTMADARRIVSFIYDDECLARPPEEALDFLAGELVRLTLEAAYRPSRGRLGEHGVC